MIYSVTTNHWQDTKLFWSSLFKACCRGIRYNDGEPFWSGFKQIWALIITTEARTVLLCFVTKILESFIILIAKKPASISVDFYDCCINRLLSSHCLEWLSFGRVERQVCYVSDEIMYVARSLLVSWPNKKLNAQYLLETIRTKSKLTAFRQ